MIKEGLKYIIPFIIGIVFILLIPKRCERIKSRDEEKKAQYIVDSINKQNLLINRQIDSVNKEINKLKEENDSLGKIKIKINQNYVIKYKEIDTLSPNGLVNEFKSIFSVVNLNR